MEKLLANLFLVVAGLALTLGNYWYTFGLWPQSWASFAAFGVGALILAAMRLGMDKH